jgi:hypothetical protein
VGKVFKNSPFPFMPLLARMALRGRLNFILKLARF